MNNGAIAKAAVYNFFEAHKYLKEMNKEEQTFLCGRQPILILLCYKFTSKINNRSQAKTKILQEEVGWLHWT